MSRLTFRKKTNICWQKQLRDNYISEGAPPIDDLSLKNAVVRPVSRKLAEQIILKYEWLGTLAAGTQRHYGIFFNGYCAGVTTFANAGAIPALMKTFKLTSDELSYLGRGACVHWAPVNTNSKLISWSCKLEKMAGYKLTIAFADTDAGEIGTIYQSCNWDYIGIGSGWFQWISPKGKIWSSNSLTKRRSKYNCSVKDIEDRLLKDGWHKQYANPKHRYVCVLDKDDKRLMRIVESMRQPYPKRQKDSSEPSAIHAEEGGAAPTLTLHNSPMEGTPE